MNAETIAECMQLSFANTPFPAVVQKLAGAGVAEAADRATMAGRAVGPGGDEQGVVVTVDLHINEVQEIL